MPRAWRDEDRIARADRSTFIVEFYLARACDSDSAGEPHVAQRAAATTTMMESMYHKRLMIDG
jgi:hypothetical protein